MVEESSTSPNLSHYERWKREKKAEEERFDVEVKQIVLFERCGYYNCRRGIKP